MILFADYLVITRLTTISSLEITKKMSDMWLGGNSPSALLICNNVTKATNLNVFTSLLKKVYISALCVQTNPLLRSSKTEFATYYEIYEWASSDSKGRNSLKLVSN